MSPAAAKAEIGHNSASVGEMLAENPEVLFREKDMLPALIQSIEKEIADHKPDLKTEKGRKAIASLAYSIAKRKTSLDESGKALNAKMRKELDVVDEVRRKLRDSLDGLRDKARAPLDAWEKAEEDRKTYVNETRGIYADAMRLSMDATFADIAEHVTHHQSLRNTQLYVRRYDAWSCDVVLPLDEPEVDGPDASA